MGRVKSNLKAIDPVQKPLTSGGGFPGDFPLIERIIEEYFRED